MEQKKGGVVSQDLAERITGVQRPKQYLTLDASVMDFAEHNRIIREDVKLNKVEYEFPAGLNKLSLFEECRALTLLEDFQAMYDVTMQLLDGKDLVINIKNDDGSKTNLCTTHVTNRFQDMTGCDAIAEYPCLITWLTEFIAEMLAKKYPLPGKCQAQNQTARKPVRAGRARQGLVRDRE